MLRAHQIRLDPTAVQEDYFRRACGTARFAYNWALAEWRRQYEAGEKPSEVALRRRLNSIKATQFPWMAEVTKVAVQQAVKNLGKAYANAFRRCKTKQRKGKKNPFGFPQFKKKGVRDAFRADNGPQDAASHALQADDRRIKLSRCGWVGMREPVRFDGLIKSAVVRRIADGWYVTVNVETEERLHGKPTAGDVVGVDLGISRLATLSTGEVVEAVRPLKMLLGRLKRLSRALSRKVKGSANRGKARTKLARLHNRISNVRKDALHKLTHKLATEYRTVAIEDLNVSGMLKNNKLSRHIADVGFFEFRRQLEYKCAMTGALVHIVDRWFPSSKTCSGCGQIHGMSLAERVMACDCGLTMDRDLNASVNLMRQALPYQPVERQALVSALCARIRN